MDSWWKTIIINILRLANTDVAPNIIDFGSWHLFVTFATLMGDDGRSQSWRSLIASSVNRALAEHLESFCLFPIEGHWQHDDMF